MEEKLIYVIDDEKDIREMEKTFLENEGYRVETFANADDAMAVMGLAEADEDVRHPGTAANLCTHYDGMPDLILMDIMMPGTGGLTACSRIRKSEDPRLRALPVILVSAKDTPLDRVTGLTMGSDDYLIKPFLPLELVARVKALLRRSDILRDQLLNSTENMILNEDGTKILGENSGKNLNGVKRPQNVGENQEKCGNLVVNFAAHRVYVECGSGNPRNSGPVYEVNVDKDAYKSVVDIHSEARKISGIKYNEKFSNGEERITALEVDNFKGIKIDKKSLKNEEFEENEEKIKGKRIMEVQVTPMEFDFVSFLILRKETAVSKAELLRNVWKLPDAELLEDVRMTDDLVKRLRKKLRAAGSTARVETVWGFGYRMTEN
ncbi:hypothetical protein BXO88_01165 [Oribacterium sp. C9]|uniref:winged helix-turn-helix transcriptional regulator n=1 Tax=Oribacterium sp. C9 TaxID=1943579 RepID=UPI0009D10B33|nr:response regulator transcription factor [Oribacterium sp. C9]OON88432.1 hypothetical protein BXO88_01165 [Oribacterium sp. C9]